MKNKKLIRFYEHERVSYQSKYSLVGDENGSKFLFEARYIDAISQFYGKGGKDYFSLEHNGIKFKQFVGAIQIFDLTIEVLPKVDRDNNGSKSLWHSVLIDMLSACKKLKSKSYQLASLKIRSNSILELYIELFVNELEYLAHRGLVKKYRKTEGNQSSLKGALLFHNQIQHNLIHAERFYIRNTIYDRDHLLHQILRQALEVCDKLSSNLLSDRIKRLLLVWPESQFVNVYPELFKRFSHDRKFSSYKEAIGIAKLLLLNCHPDVVGGTENVMALMFDMNRLWEEFVYQMLKSSAEELNIEVHQQTNVDFWNSGSSSKGVKPDLVVISGDNTIVIDTKWKQPDDHYPDDGDLKQMLIYKLYYHANEAVLLYPCFRDSYNVYGNYYNELHYTVNNKNVFAISNKLKLNCRMGYLNLMDDGGV